MKKLYIPKLNGFVWVETYNGKREEQDRAKIFDENKNYIDYISLDGTSKEKYNRILDIIANSKDIEMFIDNVCGVGSYDYSESLEYLLWSIYDDCDEETANELDHDLEILTEKEIVDKYMLNRIGNTYFYVGEY